MGKTKTTFVSDNESKPSGKDAYEERKKKKEAKAKLSEKVHIAGLKGGQRIKMVEADLSAGEAVETPSPTQESPAKAGDIKKAKKTEKIRGYKYKYVKAKVSAGKSYNLDEAVSLVKETSYSKFVGSIELHLVVKKTGLSANVTLPYPAGKEKKVEIVSDKTLEKLKAGKIDFDILLSTPDFMPKLVPFAKVLGPKGLMPNPKNGTLVSDASKAKSFKTSAIMVKTEKEAPLIHLVVGKVNQKDEEIASNIKAVLDALGGAKQVLKTYIKATMGPSIKIEV